MRLQDLRLTLDNINPKQTPGDCVDCVAAALQTDKATNTINGIAFDCIGARGSRFAVKLENNEETKAVLEEVQHLLKKTETVRLVPDNIRITPYAFLTDKGSLLSGVSVKADSIAIKEEEEEIPY
ncbi:MAG: hypothetical protein HFG42_13610 [Lachnospiraceae bacterium]|jgi:hypothetical protein|nr:hypothetical protein [Lachnospiraceae bacterium]